MFFKSIRIIVLTISFFFLFLVAINIEVEKISSIAVFYDYLILSIIISIAFRFQIAFIWYSNIKRFSVTELHFAPICEVFSASWIARYIPGGIFSYVNRSLLAKEHSVDYKMSIGATLIETILQLISLCIIFSIAVLLSSTKTPTDEVFLLVCLAAIIIFCILVAPPTKKLILRALPKNYRDKFSLPSISTKTIAFGLLKYLFAMVAANIAFLLFSLALNVGSSDLLTIILANVTVSILSMLAFFIPAGIGIREVGLTAILAPVIGSEKALALSLLARVWTIACDVIFYIMAVILSKWQKQK